MSVPSCVVRRLITSRLPPGPGGLRCTGLGDAGQLVCAEKDG